MQCPVCGSSEVAASFSVRTVETENGVRPDAFRPSSERFGAALGRILRCRGCGHGYVDDIPERSAVARAYSDAADPTSIKEEAGQVETARRSLTWIESVVSPGRLVDFGCWTGSFLVAAQERGWQATGVEPSRWAVEQATARGVDVRLGNLQDSQVVNGLFEAVVACDVIEHLDDPAQGLSHMARWLSPDGVLVLTLPDAGSATARLMGSRWWSVLPMHLQYFTRESVKTLLTRCGFSVIGIRTHPKVFTMRYYAERLKGYSETMGALAVRCVDGAGFANRLVAPDFRDRMQVMARPAAHARPQITSM